VQRSWSSWSETGTSLYRISSMKSRARTMHCKETAQTRIKSSSVTRWIGAIGSLLVQLFQFDCLSGVQLLCSRRAVFSPRGFCPFDTHSIVSPHGSDLNRCHKGVWTQIKSNQISSSISTRLEPWAVIGVTRNAVGGRLDVFKEEDRRSHLGLDNIRQRQRHHRKVFPYFMFYLQSHSTHLTLNAQW